MGMGGFGQALRAQIPASAPITQAQQIDSIIRPEILIGRVVTDSGVPVPTAQVIVTRAPDRLSQTTETGVDGRWNIRFAEGTGDYLVYIAGAGWKTFRKRVTRGTPGFPSHGSSDSIYVVNAALQKAVSQLQTVIVEANKAHPARPVMSPISPPRPGEAERWVDDFSGALPPDLAGDLAAGAATTPGIVATPTGGSALGLGAGQTSTTLGGLQFIGTDLPRDARTFIRVSTSTYDPARGWFGGAQIAAELSPGSAYSLRRGHITLDDPALQTTDPMGSSLGQSFRFLQASFGGEGGLANDRLSYNVGIQGARRSQKLPSLLNASPEALRAAGVNSDSAARLIGLLESAGVPVNTQLANSRWEQRTNEQLSFVGRLGNPYYDYKKFEVVRRIIGVTGFANWRRSEGLGIGPTTTPTRGGRLTSRSLGIQGLYSAYLTKRDWLLEARSGLSAFGERQSPYLLLPGAQVLVGTGPIGTTALTSSAGASGLVPLMFGGNGFLESNNRTWLWESLGSLAFYPPGRNRHQLALTADIRLDGLHDEPVADRFGTFVYHSLDDFAADQGASFTRVLGVPSRRAKLWNGFVSLGDDWQVGPSLRVLYGLRAEGNAYVTHPTYNVALDRALGVRTDLVPNRFGVSPRFGFTWRRTAADDGYTMGRFGNFRIPYASVLRGGIGEFRTLLRPEAVAEAASATGLPGSTRRLLCTGPAVPSSAWDGWVAGTIALPTMCGGGSPNNFADTVPSVFTLDRSYTPPKSWRANLAWTGVASEVVFNVEGIYSLNLSQVGTTDANFSGIPRFSLPNENRPVYVSPASIVPATGLVSPVEARVSPSFGRVVVQQSDLRSVSRQLAITLTPLGANLRRWWASGSYVLGSMRQQSYGFDGGAFKDPRMHEWARGDLDVRHQFLLQAGVGVKSVTVTLFGRVSSGVPYTPLVGADINGDGLVNDRAFVFNPAAPSTEPALASEMRALLAAAPREVRQCLTRSLGSVARRNSCEGPWTAALNARVALDGAALKLGQRTSVAINVTNPLGGLDRVLHGNNIRGWGQPALPDPLLLQVRAFNQADQRFEYALNPRFGDVRPSAAPWRIPFRITLDISFDLAPPLAQQQLNKWLTPGRRGRPGPRLSAADIAKRYARNTPDPYGVIMREADSLLLTPPQIAALQVAQANYRTRTDSAWAGLAEYLANLGDEYSASALTERQAEVADVVWEIARADVQARIPDILTPIQIRLMPAIAADLYSAKSNRKRSYFFF